MVRQGTFLDWVEERYYNFAGMLHRRVPRATALRVLLGGGALGLCGPLALFAQDIVFLMAGALPMLVLEAVLRLRR